MKTKIFLAFVARSIVALNTAFSQEKFAVVTLSPRVGEVISASERSEFGLFKGIDNFISAVILKCENGDFLADVTFRDVNGSMRDTVYRCPLPLLVNMADRINHYEALQLGTYKIGQDRTVLSADGKAFVMRVAGTDSKDIAAHAGAR